MRKCCAKMAMAVIASLSCGPILLAAAAPYRAIDLYTLATVPGFKYIQASQYPRAIADGQTVGVAALGVNVNPYHAALMTGSGPALDLNPTQLGIDISNAYATNGHQQVGDGVRGNGFHALLWNGSASSAVDLAPTTLARFVDTEAVDTDGIHQVGTGWITTNLTHALLWTGTADSAVDLSPTNLGFTSASSEALGVDGTNQVGFVQLADGRSHAILWHGTAASAVDLNPAGYTFTQATGVHGNQQVGSGFPIGGESHALLWTGTAASAIDLQPTQWPQILNSVALATNGTQQIGRGMTSTGSDALLLWTGTADSAVDLGALLPNNLTGADARSIDSAGDVFGIGFDRNGMEHAIEWVRVPEPGNLILLVPLAGALRRYRKSN